MAKKILTIYVYYKIPILEHEKCLMNLHDLHQAIQKMYPDLKIRQEKRLDVDSENRELWMEVYQGIAKESLQQFSTDLSRLASQHHLPKERRFEIFISM